MWRRVPETFSVLCIVALSLIAAPPAHAEKTLTLERLFADPPLVGSLPRGLQYAPDGKSLAYLKAATDLPGRYDLWTMDVASGKQRPVFTMAALLANQTLKTRAVSAALIEDSTALTLNDFQWSPDGRAILFTLAGDIFLYDLDEDTLRAVTDTRDAEAEVRFAPDGEHLAYVRDGDLRLLDLASGREQRLTETGRSGGPVRNGLPDFIATHEMRRESAYWWSPDERDIAFIETNEAGLDTSSRIGLGADGFTKLEPAFPRAGQKNVRTRLGIVSTGRHRIHWAELPDDGYIVTVRWLPDASGLAVVYESRDQKTVDLLLLDRRGHLKKALLREQSDTWINLHQDLYFFPDRPQFLWMSEQGGAPEVYLYNGDGTNLGPLTTGMGFIDDIAAVSPKTNRLFVEGWAKSPLEKHLFVVDLDPTTTAPPERVTRDGDWHKALVGPREETFVDVATDPTRLPTVALRTTGDTLLHWIAENRLTPDHPYWPYASAHAAPTFGTLKAADGATLHYRLVRPKGDGPFPVIIHVYGGPKGQLVRKSWMPLWYQVAVSQGYAVFSLDNRGTARRGHAFEEKLAGELGKVEVADQILGLDWLRRQPFVDRDRIAVYGWSYGGYMALKMILAAPDKLAAAVAGAPVTDWRLYDTHYTERYLGLPGDNPDGYGASDVFPEITGLKRPLLLLHGLADDNVSIINSTRVMAALQENAVPFDVMVYPGASHSIRGNGKERHVFETIFRFLDRTFKKAD